MIVTNVSSIVDSVYLSLRNIQNIVGKSF